MEQDVKSVSDYLAAFRRRRVQFSVTTAVLAVIALVVAVALPPVYRSSATILIEQQDIPQELVRSTVTSFADERIQIISQRVMTSSNLKQIIDKYDLYRDKRKRETNEEIQDRMRDDISLKMVSADVIDPRSGRPTQATIAFTLSYDSVSPELAQKVANELVSLYLNENFRSRTEKTAETAGFLSDEADKLGGQIAELEAKLAEFKQKNAGQLPEQMQLNMQVMERIERDLQDTESKLQAAEQQKIMLSAQVEQLEPHSTLYTANGERVLGAEARLKTLQAQYVSASAVYGANHPDVVKMRKEIAALENEVGGADASDLGAKLETLRAELAVARNKYSEKHPDVKRLEREIATLEETLGDASARPVAVRTVAKPDNPAYITLAARLEEVKVNIKALQDGRRDLKAKLANYEERLAQSPEVEREYRAMLRDYDNAVLKYREIKAKQMEAVLAEQMEKERKGERFSLIDPPRWPERPEKPNRLAIMLLGLVMSMGGGAGAVAVSESMDHAVRGTKGLTAVTGVTPLGAIPFINAERDLRGNRRNRRLAVLALVVAVLTALALVHFLYRPLDVLWFVGLRRLGL